MRTKSQIEDKIMFHKEQSEQTTRWEKQRHLDAIEYLTWVLGS